MCVVHPRYRDQQKSPCRLSSSKSRPIRSGLSGGAPAHYPILKNSIFRVDHNFGGPPAASRRNYLGIRRTDTFRASHMPWCEDYWAEATSENAISVPARFPSFSISPGNYGRLGSTHAVVLADNDSRDAGQARHLELYCRGL